MEQQARRCPACKRRQGYVVEILGVLILAGIVAWTAWSGDTPATPLTGVVPSIPPPPAPAVALLPDVPATPATPPQPVPAVAAPAPMVSDDFFHYASATAGHPAVLPVAPSPPPVISAQAGTTHYGDTQFLNGASGNFSFYVAEKRPDPRTGVNSFFRLGLAGREVPNAHPETRRSMLSEFQGNYPVPQSGCGPTAILDYLIWYENFGLVPRSTKVADTVVYKRQTFDLIDRTIGQVKGEARNPVNGTNHLEMVVAFDRIMQDLSQGRVRLGFEIKPAPLKDADLLRVTTGFRAGIVSVQLQDPKTKSLLGYHAVSVVGEDTDGVIVLANWGGYWAGRLVSRPDGQWFIPSDPKNASMKIVALLTLIPFTPSQPPAKVGP